METPVIARDADSKPLIRVALDRRHGLIYLANPKLLDAIRRGDSEPVGFPERDVFMSTSETEQAIAEGLQIDWSQLRRLVI